jgi:N,N-dimethylformamidase
VQSTIDGVYPVDPQRTQVGSHVIVPDLEARITGVEGLTLHLFLWPTLPGKERQGVISRWSEKDGCGWALLIENGRLVFLVSDGKTQTRVECPNPLFPETWYSVIARVDTARSTVSLSQVAKVNSVNSRFGLVVDLDSDAEISVALRAPPGHVCVPVIIAGIAESVPERRVWVIANYNGKIDAPKFFGRALSETETSQLHAGLLPFGATAHWDFAAEITAEGIPTDSVTDVTGNGFAGHCINQPDRATTGWNWQGREEHFIHCPEQYGALWFHNDSLDDCRWDRSLKWQVPDDFPTGVYALTLNMSGIVDRVPFFVVPQPGRASASVAVVMPTFSYLAYANSQVMQNAAIAQSVLGVITTLDEIDLALNLHTEYGRSTYDYHLDGRGVAYSSWRRPILNMRPEYRHEYGSVWQFPADLHLVNWLTQKGIAFDVLTDHDLHAQGASVLSSYAVVISPSHAEYASGEMLDAYEQYFAAGGRGMYLGGNGFYWVTSLHPAKPWMIEVRRGESGDQGWRARPGELHHSTTGERGGLWRHRARAPQKIWGTGYTAHGLDVSTGYFQLPDAADPRVAWIMEGVGRAEIVGDFGLINGGASGLEYDRIDYSLGTPPNTMLLASSHGHSANTTLVPEDQYFSYPGITGRDNPLVRADLLYFTTRSGGAVFSTSSMAWCGSLSHNDYANNVSRITENVIRRFATAKPLPEII